MMDNCQRRTMLKAQNLGTEFAQVTLSFCMSQSRKKWNKKNTKNKNQIACAAHYNSVESIIDFQDAWVSCAIKRQPVTVENPRTYLVKRSRKSLSDMNQTEYFTKIGN